MVLWRHGSAMPQFQEEKTQDEGDSQCCYLTWKKKSYLTAGILANETDESTHRSPLRVDRALDETNQRDINNTFLCSPGGLGLGFVLTLEMFLNAGKTELRCLIGDSHRYHLADTARGSDSFPCAYMQHERRIKHVRAVLPRPPCLFGKRLRSLLFTYLFVRKMASEEHK